MLTIFTAIIISIQPLWYPLTVNPIDLPIGKTEFVVTPIWPFYGAFLYNSRAKVFLHGGWLSLPTIDWRWFGFDYWNYMEKRKLVFSLGVKRIQSKTASAIMPIEDLEVDYLYLWEFTGELIYKRSFNTFGMSLGYSRTYYHPVIFNFSLSAFNATLPRASFFYSYMPVRTKAGFVCDMGMWGDAPYAGMGSVLGGKKTKVDLSLLFTLSKHDKLVIVPTFRLWAR